MALPAGTVTFLFTDIEGSTRLWEQHPEAMRNALARHDALAAALIEQHDGTLVKSRGEGDSLFAVFAQPGAAVAAAGALQQAFLAEPWPAETPLRVRVALHTGEADRRGGDYYGAAVNRCARLRAVAHGGQVLLSQATADMVREHLPAGASLRDLGAHRLKDLQQPEHLFQLLHPALPGDFPPLRSLEAFAHNLPRQLTSFVGREKEMAEVKQLLATTCLLTLTGSGGCGKTRLALQVAADLVEGYADGVWLVELAPLADPALVAQTVAAALGVREEPGRPVAATLADYLRVKSLLLLLDNCEHLLSACAQLTDALLRGSPNLRVMASSREGLGIGGERTYRVPSLSLPEPREGLSPERLTQCEAARLFVERAVFSQPSFVVTEQNAAAVAQVCQRLDGIPLALELAAARVKALPVEQIAARLDDRFRLLTGGSRTALPRQQTLQALIDWSYNLLSEAERMLLRRLSAFAGGWTLEGAEAVCAGQGVEDREVLDLMSHLVDKSLVLYEEQGKEARYRLLETVRQYGRDRLLEAGEVQAVRGHHRDFFLALAERAEPELRGSEQSVWFERLDREYDNLRAALAWSVETRQVDAGLRLAAALWWFWTARSHFTEGRGWLEGLLERSSGVAAGVRAAALTAAGNLAYLQGDNERARVRLETSLALSQEAGDKWHIALSLGLLGVVTLNQGDDERAKVLLEESLVVSLKLGDEWLIAASLNFLGMAVRGQGDYGRAKALWEESVARFRKVEERWFILYPLLHLGNVALSQGQHEQAKPLYEESLGLARKRGHQRGIAGCLEGLAGVWAAQGRPERAARLLGAAEAIREAANSPLPPVWRADYERSLAAARAALGEEVFAAAWAEGRAISLEQTVEYALEDLDAPTQRHG